MLFLIFFLYLEVIKIVGSVDISVGSSNQTNNYISFVELEEAFEWITQKQVDDVLLIISPPTKTENLMLTKPWIFSLDIFILEAKDKEGTLDINFQNCSSLYFERAKKIVLSNVKFSWEKNSLKICKSSIINLNHSAYFACKVKLTL